MRCGEVLTSGWRRLERRLARQPLARLTIAAPRTARWVFEQLGTQRVDDGAGAPHPRITAALVAHVAMDESVMAVVMGPNRFPRRADYERVSAELATARQLFERRGWIDHPETYHRPPPPMVEPDVTHGWALGRAYERFRWPSGYSPPGGVPGSERWAAFEANRTASAWVLRHGPEPRPWIVLVHGFGTGSVFMDLVSFRAAHLHRDLGCNVAAIVLPAHGSRRPSRISGEPFLSFDLMNAVHGFAQSVWDLRRLLGWIRSQEPEGIGLFGVSMGGGLAALTAAFEADLDLVLAGIPMSDFCGLLHHHAPHHLRVRAIEHEILDGNAEAVHRVVMPTALPVATRPESLAVFAALGDRLSPPSQAQALIDHWGRPQTCWYPANHVGYLWSPKVWRFVDDCLEGRGLTRPPRRGAVTDGDGTPPGSLVRR